MKIKYFFNDLKIEDLSTDEIIKADEVIVKLREDITDWSAKVRFKKIAGKKTLIETFMWKGMSTWWLNRLAIKDSFSSTDWINRLVILYLAKDFAKDKVVKIYTDDQILKKTLESNNTLFDVSISYVPEPYQKLKKCYSILNRIAALLVSFFRHLRVHFIVAKFKGRFHDKKSKKPIIWFKTSYPVNWKEGRDSRDRLLGETPLLDSAKGFKSVYLAFISISQFKFLELKRNIENLHLKAQREVAFPEAELSINDILSVYFSTFCEQLKFVLLSRSRNFTSNFVLDGINVSDILLSEWAKSYWGYQQFSKLQGISSSKFFKKIDGPQTVITYGEFFPQNRACYFMTKKVKPDTTFIAIQHAMNAKNKMFTYFRSSEFLYDGVNHGKDYSPYPDYFFVQGEQYQKILSEFFPSENIEVIGSLKKIEQPLSVKNDIFEGLLHSKKKLLLLAPSVGDDYKIIFSFFKDWISPKDWQIVLCPHPMSDTDKISSYKNEYIGNIDISIMPKGLTYEVLSKSDLVVSTNSTIALEAIIFGVESVRLRPIGRVSQFDNDERIISFTSSFLFQEWLKNFSPDKEKNLSKELINDYFYKNDGKASSRVWDFIGKRIN